MGIAFLIYTIQAALNPGNPITMRNRSFSQRATKWLATLAFVSVSVVAIAQTDPTLNQVYEAVQAGRLDQAQTMMQQVLISHPNSAKAHFVQAEIAAKQGQMGRAREALATAEKLAPGLPFAKSESVQNLRTQLTAKGNSAGNPGSGTGANRASSNAAAAAPAEPFPWAMAIGVGGLLAALGLFLFRRKSAAATATEATARAGSNSINANAARPTYAGNPAVSGGGLGGPQNFGTAGPMGTGFGQGAGNGMGGGMGGTGMGGKVMGGLAAGLAVGAGVMAAQAIGKSMMGGNEHPQQASEGLAHNDLIPIDTNSDAGGQNFGVNDASSWDDGGSMASNDDNDSWDT
jgi:uncharacterized protein